MPTGAERLPCQWHHEDRNWRKRENHKMKPRDTIFVRLARSKMMQRRQKLFIHPKPSFQPMEQVEKASYQKNRNWKISSTLDYLVIIAIRTIYRLSPLLRFSDSPLQLTETVSLDTKENDFPLEIMPWQIYRVQVNRYASPSVTFLYSIFLLHEPMMTSIVKIAAIAGERCHCMAC